MKRGIFVFLLIVVFSHSALAVEYTADLSLSVSEEYNDNVLLESSDPLDDFITYLSPSIGLSLKSQTAQLSLRYTPTFSFYRTNNDLDETAHEFTAAGAVAFSEKARAELKHTFIKSSDTGDFIEIADIGPITRRLERRYNIFNTNFTYKLTQHLDSTLGISYSDLDYKEPDVSEVKTYTGHVGINYRLSEKLSFLVSGNFVKYDYRPESDATTQEYTGGVTYRFNPGFSVTLSGGPVITEIDETGETDTEYGGGVVFTMTDERLNASLALRQTVIAGLESGQPLRSSGASLTLTRELSPRWNVSLSASYNEYESVNEDESRETDSEDYDTVLIGGNITYKVRDWASLVLLYSYVDLDDKMVDTNSYTNNIVSIRLNVTHTKKF